MHSPMEQFEIKKLISFHIGSLDASFTNSALSGCRSPSFAAS